MWRLIFKTLRLTSLSISSVHMILSISSYSTTEPFYSNYSTEMESTAGGVSNNISLYGSISETRESDLQNSALLNTHTVHIRVNMADTSRESESRPA